MFSRSFFCFSRFSRHFLPVPRVSIRVGVRVGVRARAPAPARVCAGARRARCFVGSLVS